MQVTHTKDDLFDTVWYTVRETKPKLRKFGKVFMIEDDQIKCDYDKFVNSKQTIEGFFKIDLVIVSLFPFK